MMGLALYTDPVTGDLVDCDDGWFVEVEDARPAVDCQVTHHLNEWPGDPDAGSLIHLVRELGDGPDGIEALGTELRRAYGVLAAEQMIADVRVAAERSQPGRFDAEVTYRDTTTGQVVDQVVQPFGGG
jgi:hypothetical protein